MKGINKKAVIIASYLIDFYVISERNTTWWIWAEGIKAAITESKSKKRKSRKSTRSSLFNWTPLNDFNWTEKANDLMKRWWSTWHTQVRNASVKISNFFMCSLKFLPLKTRAIHFTVQCNKWPHKKASSNVKLIPRIFPLSLSHHVRFFFFLIILELKKREHEGDVNIN